MKPTLLALGLIFELACAARRASLPLPVHPDGSPEWVDLIPLTELRVENAYYQPGAPRRGLAGFLGTEIADYRAGTNGRLRLFSVESKVAQRPKDQPPVQELLSARLARYRYHRYFYQVVFKSKGNIHGAVLLGARSMSDLEGLGARLLTDPDSVCNGRSSNCAAFPEACTVALEMAIVVNGVPRSVLWGSSLGSVAVRPRTVEVLRSHGGNATLLDINPSDPSALRLPLLPGDRVTWE